MNNFLKIISIGLVFMVAIDGTSAAPSGLGKLVSSLLDGVKNLAGSVGSLLAPSYKNVPKPTSPYPQGLVNQLSLEAAQKECLAYAEKLVNPEYHEQFIFNATTVVPIDVPNLVCKIFCYNVPQGINANQIQSNNTNGPIVNLFGDECYVDGLGLSKTTGECDGRGVCKEGGVNLDDFLEQYGLGLDCKAPKLLGICLGFLSILAG